MQQWFSDRRKKEMSNLITGCDYEVKMSKPMQLTALPHYRPSSLSHAWVDIVHTFFYRFSRRVGHRVPVVGILVSFIKNRHQGLNKL